MIDEDINIGQVVRSTKGRDKGKYFIVIGKLDDNHLLIVDGDIRKIEKPKKKKVKHLMKLDIISTETIERLNSNKEITNAFIRKELKNWV
ncbi:MAG: RNA-binding protein [Clostridiales bacterium]|nr:RNA-binding protein [Clostridiales bacterium]